MRSLPMGKNMRSYFLYYTLFCAKRQTFVCEIIEACKKAGKEMDYPVINVKICKSYAKKSALYLYLAWICYII